MQESMNALLNMRRTSKEKEIEALLAGEQDPCSCYIEVRFIYESCFLHQQLLYSLIHVLAHSC